MSPHASRSAHGNTRHAPARSARPTFAIVVFSLVASAMSLAPPAAAEGADGALYVVEGAVFNGTNGTPLVNVSIRAWTANDETGEEYAAKAITDRDGRYRLELPAGEGQLHATRGGFVDETVSFALTEDGQRLDLKMRPVVDEKTTLITGIVIDAVTGKPVVDARVNAYTYYDRQYADEPRPVTAEGGSGSSGSASTVKCAPTPSDGDESSADYACTEPAFAPSPPHRWDNAYDTTGKDGRYTLKVFGGSYRVEVMAKNFVTEYEVLRIAEGDSLTHDVKLTPFPGFTALVEGRVLDKETGLPVAGADVNVNNQAWGRYNWTRTDETGRFQFQLMPGFHQLSASRWGSPYMYVAVAESAPATDVESGVPVTETSIRAPDRMPVPQGPGYYNYVQTFIVADGETKTIDVKLKPKPTPTVTIVGYVVDKEAGKGVAGANVNLWNQDTGDWGNAVTDRTGSFKILARPGYHTLNAYAEGYFGGAIVLDVQKDAGVVRQDIDVVKGETRWGWYDHEVHYAYAEKGMAMDDGAPSEARMTSGGNGAAAPTPAMAPAGDGQMDMSRSMAGSTSGGQSYQGGGGGLPPYGELGASEVPEGSEGTPETAPATGATSKQVPAFGALGLVVLAGVMALVARRRI